MIPRAKLDRTLVAGKNGNSIKVSEVLFVIWAVLVAIWWIGSSPESAPQQAALAGQALVLICVPYCVISVLQRGWAARDSARQSDPTTLDLVTKAERANGQR